MLSFLTDSVLTMGNSDIAIAVGQMTPEQIFTTYGRHIGIGGICLLYTSGGANPTDTNK